MRSAGPESSYPAGAGRGARWDAIVVGAGPAGATTAMLLGRRGHRVLLLDRSAFPRAKACGDCLSPRANTLLARLGLLDAILAEEPARLRGWKIVAPAGHAFYSAFAASTSDPFLHEALALPRSRFDSVLVGAAVAAGVTLRRARVTGATRNRDGSMTVTMHGEDAQTARLVIAADGLRSSLARRHRLVKRSPRLRKFSLTAHVSVAPLPPHGEMHVASGMCLGVAPVRGDRARANITLVADARRFGRDARNPDFFGRAIQSFPALAESVRAAAAAPGELLASGPFDWACEAPVRAGIAWTGDAAGYYDPFTGQGIYQALVCAELLAAEAHSALAGSTPVTVLDGYSAGRSRALRGAHAVQRVVETALSKPGRANDVIERLRRAPALADVLVAVAGDLRPPAALLSPRLLFTFLGPRSSRPTPESA